MDPNGRFVALGESHQRQPGRCTCCGMEASVPMPFLSIRATSSLSFLGAAAAVFSWENMENSTRKWSFEWENHGKLMPKMGKLFYKWEVQNCFNNGQLYIYIYPEMEDLLAMFDYRRVLRSGVTVIAPRVCKSVNISDVECHTMPYLSLSIYNPYREN